MSDDQPSLFDFSSDDIPNMAQTSRPEPNQGSAQSGNDVVALDSRGTEPSPVGTPRPGFDHVIATDGSCSGNPGPGGWAFVEQNSGRWASGGSPSTTNNIMELTAAVAALEFAGPDPDLLLRVDSQYVINAMTKWAPGWRKKGWKKADGKPVANRDLIERMLNLYESRTGRTEVEWVRGHSGDEANELVDSLAVAQTAKNS